MSSPTPLFPVIIDRTALHHIRKDLPALEAGLHQILRTCGLADATLSATIGGSMPVFGVNGDLIIKLFPAFCQEFFDTELASLRTLAGRTPFAVPQIRASGAFESWFYLVMTRVPGVQLITLWPGADDAKKAVLLENLGAAAAVLHRIRSGTAEEAATWRAFMARQAANCVAHHRKTGLPEDLLAQIPAYLAPALDLIATAPVVFLHTELMLEHIFVDPDRLTVAGLIDFEPSTVGAIEYDFPAVPIFMTQGRPHLLRAFLRGYGYPWDQTGFPSTRLAMTYMLLHRYSNLMWFLELLGPARPAQITRLEELEQLWWSA